MASKPETAFVRKINSHLPSAIHKEKMNNPYRGGTADVWYSGTYDCWVEYKNFPRLPSRAFACGVTPLQDDWLTGRYLEGRCVLVIVGIARREGFILTHRDWTYDVDPHAVQLLSVPDLAAELEAICSHEQHRKKYLNHGTRR